MFYDLHIHSVFSDGTWTPEELINFASENSLIMALTDHNTVSGLPYFMEAAEKAGIEAVPGIELSTEYHGLSFHILGLFIESQFYDVIEDMTRAYLKRKKESNARLIENLIKAGYDISFSEVEAQSVDGNFNRANIAAVLKEKNYVEEVSDAFDRLLSKKHGFYIPAKKNCAIETIRFIRSINAVPILAHPYLNASGEELDEFLSAAAAAGLAGMETRHSEYSRETEMLADETAKRFGLLGSGGSDFHGDNKPDISLIKGKGNLFIPESFYFEIKTFRNM